MDILGLARHGLNDFEQIAIMFVVVTAFISLIYAWYLRNKVMKKDKGTTEMQKIWNAIRIGADSYLSRQLKTILPVVALLTIAMFLSVYIVPPSREATEEFPQNTQTIIATGRAVAFILGALFSLTVGQLGMRMAIQANVRVASGHLPGQAAGSGRDPRACVDARGSAARRGALPDQFGPAVGATGTTHA